jgi:hypothetical protein
MKKTIVATFDKKMNFFPQIMIVDDEREACRSFLNHLASANENDPMCKYPQDYALVRVGSISENDTLVNGMNELTLEQSDQVILVDGTQADLFKPTEE